MKNKEKGNSNVFIILAIFVAIGVAGYLYITRDQSSDSLLISSTVDNRASVNDNFLTVLNELKRLKLDDSIFKTPVWGSLRDFGQKLTPQEKFRPNPFAPLSQTSKTVSDISTSTSR